MGISDVESIAGGDELSAYLTNLFVEEDASLERARERQVEHGMPEINVSAYEGQLLLVLLKALGARRVLEVGALGGYSGIWIARAIGEDGDLVTLECDSKHAEVAAAAFRDAEVDGRIEILVGDALASMKSLAGPFDAIFLDADKEPLPQYFEQSMRLLREGGLLLCDNTFMGGRVVDEDSRDAGVEGMRRFNELVSNDDRLSSSVIPVRDGLLVAVKNRD